MKNSQALDTRGYTIIESLITVMIVGVLGIVAIPRFSAVANESTRAEALGVLQRICSAADSVKALDGAYPATLSDGDDWNVADEEVYAFGYRDGVAIAAKRAETGATALEMDCTSRTTM